MQWFLHWEGGDTTPPGDIWQCLETFWVVMTGRGATGILWLRSGMLLNIYHVQDNTPHKESSVCVSAKGEKLASAHESTPPPTLSCRDTLTFLHLELRLLPEVKDGFLLQQQLHQHQPSWRLSRGFSIWAFSMWERRESSGFPSANPSGEGLCY